MNPIPAKTLFPELKDLKPEAGLTRCFASFERIISDADNRMNVELSSAPQGPL